MLVKFEPAHRVNPYNAAALMDAPEPKPFRLTHRRLSFPLQVVSRLAFILPYMIPDDLHATLSIGLPCGPGETAPSSWMCIILLANTIKWPAAVRNFYAELRKNGLVPKATQDGLAPKATQDGLVPDLSRLGLGAEHMAQAYRSTLVWASGRAWGHMFSRMDSGLQSAQSGLADGCKLAFAGKQQQPSRLQPSQEDTERWWPGRGVAIGACGY